MCVAENGQQNGAATRLPRRERISGHCWGKRRSDPHPGNPDSCAGVTAYCSLMTVRYDISCGRLSPESVPTRYSVLAASVCRIGEGFCARGPATEVEQAPNDVFGPEAARHADLDRRTGRAIEEI